jgi:GNAT superfamily N-acetyltransferase
LLAYANGEAVGWCALAPREQYPRFSRSRILKPVDAKSVWSITCFFVARPYRRRGVSLALLRAAAAYAASCGAQILEGYPTEPKPGYPDVFYYVGLTSTFRKAGFQEVARRSASRPIFRLTLGTDG